MTARAHRAVHLGNRQGLHARPAARLVAAARRFTAEIVLVHGAQRASAKELLDVLFLAAPGGASLEVEAVGEDAEEAAAAIAAFFAALPPDA